MILIKLYYILVTVITNKSGLFLRW